MKEQWKWIMGYKGRYKISNWGRVTSYWCKQGKRKTARIMKYHKDIKGYYQYVLCLNGQYKGFRSCRLVALHFIPNPLNKPCVNHKNGIKNNDHFINLEWCTPSKNIQHAIRVLHRKFGGLGEHNGMAKLNNNSVKKIRELYKTGKYYQRQLGQEFGVSRSCIGRIITNTDWKGL